MHTHANKRPPRAALIGPAAAALVALLSAGRDARAAAVAVNKIAAVEVASAGEGETRVYIRGSARPTFTVFKLAEPARVVVDIAGADVTSVSAPLEVKKGGVLGITTAQFDEGARRVARVVVALDGDVRYDVSASGTDLVVTVGRPVAQAAAPAPVAAPTATAAVAPAPAAAPVAAPPAAPVAPSAAAPADPNVVLSRTDDFQAENPAGKLTSVSARAEGRSSIVQLKTDGQVGTYTLIELQNPGRLALDLPGVTMQKNGLKAAGAGPVKGVRVARNLGGVRVVLDGKADRLPPYQIERSATGLSVRVGQAALAKSAPKAAPAPAPKATQDSTDEGDEPAEAAPSAPVKAAAKIEPKKAEQAPLSEVKTAIQAVPAPKKAEAVKKLALVKAVDLLTDDGQTRVVIALEGHTNFSIRNLDATTSELTLFNATIPARLERNLDASALSGPVTMVSSYHSAGRHGEVKIVATLRSPQKSDAAVKNGHIEWKFGGPQALAQASSQSGGAAAMAAESRAASSSSSAFDSANYTGRRVDFNVKDMDIRNLLSAIAEISRRNIIIGDDVTGRVTIKLRNVPWDQALDIILKTKNLGREEVGNIIRVAPLAALRAEAKEAAEAQKVQADLEPLKVRLIPVNYAKAEQMMDKVKDSLTARGAVSVDVRTNTLIVKDGQDALARVEGIIRSLDTATPEVLIEARIVEASTSFSRQVGIQWGGNVSFAPTTGNPTGLVFPNILQVAGAADDPAAPTGGLTGITQPNFAVNMPAPIGLNNGAGLGFVFGSAGGAANLNLRLSAAENSGTIKTVSSPRVVTLDNVEASVGQGVQIPYSQVSAAGVNTTFIEAKLELRVSPHVTQDGSIQMKITATNNQPNPQLTGANGQPSISRRDAKTEVLVRDGDTTVIGGIYTRANSEQWNEVPLLSRIPILGWLFKKKAVTDNRTELLIFITPRIVNRSQSVVAVQKTDDPVEKQ